MENVDRTDLMMPRLRVLQPMSQEVIGNEGRAGEFVNSLTGENYGTEIRVVISHFFKSRTMFEEQGKELKCWSPNAVNKYDDSRRCSECPHSSWEEQVAPRCSIVYNFPSVLISEDGSISAVANLTLMRSGIKAAKKLITQVNLSGGQWWDKMYRTRTLRVEGEKGTYFVLDFKPIGDTDDILKKRLYLMYQTVQGGKVEVEAGLEE